MDNITAARAKYSAAMLAIRSEHDLAWEAAKKAIDEKRDEQLAAANAEFEAEIREAGFGG